MSARLDGQIIRLEGDCRAEDAEALTALLDGEGQRTVDLSACTRLHGAVLQALLVLRPPLAGTPTDAFLARWIVPKLTLPLPQ